MRKTRQKILGVKIEYHWFHVKLLKKRMGKNGNKMAIAEKIRMHKNMAEEYSIQYEISLGVRKKEPQPFRVVEEQRAA